MFFFTFSLPSASWVLKVPNKELHRRSDTAIIYVSRKKGGGGLISCEACVFGEENSLSWYVRNSEKVLLGKVGEKGTVKVDEAKYPKEYQKSEKREMENKWKEKQMRGQFVRDMTGREWIGRKYGSSYARGTSRDVQKL